jgi:hypothetical protein
MPVRKVVLMIVGALLTVAAFGIAVGGGALVGIHATQRDASGFYTTPFERLDTPTAALTSEIDLGTALGGHDGANRWRLADLRFRVTSFDRPVFVGIAPTSAVDRWLAETSHEEITSMGYGPFRTRTEMIGGVTGVAGPPAEQSFWAAQATGTGTVTLRWPAEAGRWTTVLMNADGSPGVTADVSVGAKTGLLLAIGIGMLIGGFTLLAALLLVLGLHATAPSRPGAVSAGTPVPASPGSYPVRLDGHLDAPSRWLWLVKWILLVPHFVVLAFLWLAAAVLTLVAGVAILVTGRYPRGIFDFNVGVLRWTWRVSFYAMGAFATDRYPPFSLQPDATYPADLDVPYPERLSRGLVLVKSWLLALPHLVIIGILAGGGAAGWIGRDNEGWRVAGGGLIAVLALIAAVVLAFTGRYPGGLFDLVMGMNRWVYRVLAYVGLMRDEYPPFRLDMGGADPGTPLPVPPPPTAPDRSGDLVGAAH